MLRASSSGARTSLTSPRLAPTRRAGSAGSHTQAMVSPWLPEAPGASRPHGHAGGPGVRDMRNLYRAALATGYRAALAAGVLALTAPAAAAAMSDVFSPGPRLDLAAELDYRGRYLSVDDVEHDAPPPDRVGREQLGDAKARVARHYVRELGYSLADEVLASFPGLAELDRRYNEATTFRFFLRQDSLRQGSPAIGLSGAAPGPASTDGRLFRPAAVGPSRRPEARDPLTVRLRLNGRLDRFAPAVEVTHGALRGRLSFDTTREWLELTLARRLWKSLELECAGTESLRSGGSQFRLALTLPF